MVEMDPVSIALITAATVIGKAAASEAVKDAYHGLKALIRRKSGGGPKADVVLDNLDSKPKIWAEPLKELLQESKMDTDPEVVDAARNLMELVGPSQIAVGDHNIQVAGDVDTLVQGDYIGAPVQSTIPWRNRPGGPQFRLSPIINAGRLLCSFQVDAGIPPGGVEARWVGGGTDHEWTEPMVEPVHAGANFRKYQLKSVEMNPTPPQDEVVFEVRFNLDDRERGGRWVWPIEQHEKSHWNLEAQKGSGVFQPRLEDTW